MAVTHSYITTKIRNMYRPWESLRFRKFSKQKSGWNFRDQLQTKFLRKLKYLQLKTNFVSYYYTFHSLWQYLSILFSGWKYTQYRNIIYSKLDIWRGKANASPLLKSGAVKSWNDLYRERTTWYLWYIL